MLLRGLIAISSLVFALSLTGCGERDQARDDAEQVVSTTAEDASRVASDAAQAAEDVAKSAATEAARAAENAAEAAKDTAKSAADEASKAVEATPADPAPAE